MQQAQAQAQQGNPGQSQQAQQQAAQALDRAAQQAGQAAQQMAASVAARQPQQGQTPGAQAAQQQTGQSLQQAQGQMAQAQGQLGQGQNQAAQGSMQQAAQALQQAAAQVAQQPGQPGQPSGNSPGLMGAAAQGKIDLSIFGKDLKKYAGKSWGDCRGELRTRIVQDMKQRYGEDYARIIKLYFEQIASSRSQANQPPPRHPDLQRGKEGGADAIPGRRPVVELNNAPPGALPDPAVVPGVVSFQRPDGLREDRYSGRPKGGE